MTSHIPTISIPDLNTFELPARSRIVCELSINDISCRFPPVGVKRAPELLLKTVPRAAAMPQPPSLVQLPPRPTIILRAPRDMASLISIPTPKVVEVITKLPSPEGEAFTKPATLAVSMTAVVPAMRYGAVISSPEQFRAGVDTSRTERWGAAAFA